MRDQRRRTKYTTEYISLCDITSGLPTPEPQSSPGRHRKALKGWQSVIHCDTNCAKYLYLCTQNTISQILYSCSDSTEPTTA